MLKVFALFLLSSCSLFGQQLAYPNVKANPDTLEHTVIIYQEVESIIVDVVRKDKFLENVVNWRDVKKIETETTYVGPATVNDEYYEYIEVINIKIISH